MTPYFREFLSHLDELRRRVFRIVIILAVGTAAGLFFSDYILAFISERFSGADQPTLALLYPTEGFVVRMKIGFVAALFVMSPFWFAQLWGFVGPGLYENEKKVIFPIILASSGVFILGAAFGYYILPIAANYFKSLAPEDVAVYWSLGKYVDFALRILVAFGVVFELPLVIFAASRLGLVQPHHLRKYRRHAYIAVLLTAAVITPPDLFTQVLLAVPLVLLYEVGILMAVIAGKPRRQKTLKTV
jgi:sec-independent protein translocase protein TatC